MTHFIIQRLIALNFKANEINDFFNVQIYLNLIFDEFLHLQ